MQPERVRLQHRRATPLPKTLWLTLAGVVTFLPLIVSNGHESFRYPKELLLRTGAILLLAIFIIECIRRRITARDVDWKKAPPIVLALGALGWVLVCTIFSTNRSLSMDTVIRAASTTVLFLASYLVGRHRTIPSLGVLLLPAGINAVLLVLQSLEIWNPFVFPKGFGSHLKHTALIGNPNDVGMFMLPASLVALAMTFCVPPKFRIALMMMSALLISGLFLARSVTAVVALIPAVIALLWIISPRVGAIAALGVPCVAIVLVSADPGLRQRAGEIAASAAARDYDAVLSFRLTAFLAASRMAADHPVTGVGPGCFAWQYFPYKIEVQREHPELNASAARGINFGEVHNDHLETLAETGFIGYMLFLASIAMLARNSTNGAAAAQAHENQSAKLARILSLPLALSFAIVTLAQFPMQLAAPTAAYLFTAGFLLAWSDNVSG